MDIRKLKLLLNTLKYLKFVQIYYRVYYLIRNNFLGSEPKKRKVPVSNPIFWKGGIRYSNRYFGDNSFEFLNIKNQFPNEIDWNFDAHGKLWTYNLNYFDFLNQSEMSKELGLKLIQDYTVKEISLKDGKEPYPISLRLINWVKFLSENKVKEIKIDQVLYHHVRTLIYNLEFHLLANHLLENAFALLFGGYYFQDGKFYSRAKKLLISELNEQILKDGAHYELSPMYHQILFHRLLDCIQLIRLNHTWQKDNLLSFLEDKAAMMRSWIEKVTYKNGDIPMISDAALGIAPTSIQLLQFANALNISSSMLSLSESGYRKIVKDDFELFMDIGNIQPSYQPGHTHSDTFHFDLYKSEKPIFVDTGVSTYEKNERRHKERSTSSHNTVTINNKNQTEVWGGFRVARRAKVESLVENENILSAVHDGYKKYGFLHKRIFDWSSKNTIIIEDDISLTTESRATALFHLDQSIEEPKIEKDEVRLEDQNITIKFKGQSKVEVLSYKRPNGYNRFNLAYKIIVTFDRNLVTQISL